MKVQASMHRTQIYLNESLHDSLKARAHRDGISMSELIRRTLEDGIQKDLSADARHFFDRLQPLQSLANADPVAYVDALRSNSRLPRFAREE